MDASNSSKQATAVTQVDSDASNKQQQG